MEEGGADAWCLTRESYGYYDFEVSWVLAFDRWTGVCGKRVLVCMWRDTLRIKYSIALQDTDIRLILGMLLVTDPSTLSIATL